MVATQTKNYGQVHSVDDLAKLAKAMGQDNRAIGFDIETGYHGPDRKDGSLMTASGAFVVGFSFTVETNWARYVPLRHDYADNLDVDKVWEIMFPLLDASKAQRVVAHHAKFEKRNMRNEGIELGILRDTILDAFVLSEWKLVGLKALIEKMFGHKMVEIGELFPDLTQDKLSALRFNLLELTAQVIAYACEDALWALAAYYQNAPKVQETRQLMGKLEHQIIEFLCDMEDRGVGVEWEEMEAAYAAADRFVPYFAEEVRSDFEKITGQPQTSLNLNSHPQIRRLLFEDMGLRATVMTKGGKSGIPQEATNEIALKGFAKSYPAIAKLLELREIENLQNRLGKWLEKPKGAKAQMSKVEPIRGLDGRVHASYNQVVVGSGRFSADNPAIQQCPKNWFHCFGRARQRYDAEMSASGDAAKAEAVAREAAEDPSEIWEGNFRRLIIPTPGTYFLGFDYSQIELRAIAGLAGEKTLMDAFERGDDVHSLTAARMLGKRFEDIDEDRDRPVGKTMNFALVYQMGVKSLADRLAIPLDRAKELYENYFAQFPAIMTWVENAKMTGKQQGYIETYFGRKWTIWELVDTVSPAMYAKGERMAVNGPVQGWAADYMKLAMVRIMNTLKAEGLWCTEIWPLMNQHDALVFEVAEERSPNDVMDLLMPRVEFPIEGFPSIRSDWELGYRWGDGMSKIKPGSEIVLADSHWAVTKPGKLPEPVPAPAPAPVVMATSTVSSTTSLTSNGSATVVVSMNDMPTKTQFHSFLALTSEQPGPNHVTLRTPQGEVMLPHTTGLSLNDTGRIGVVLPGSSVSYRAEDVDLAEMATKAGLG